MPGSRSITASIIDHIRLLHPELSGDARKMAYYDSRRIIEPASLTGNARKKVCYDSRRIMEPASLTPPLKKADSVRGDNPSLRDEFRAAPPDCKLA